MLLDGTFIFDWIQQRRMFVGCSRKQMAAYNAQIIVIFIVVAEQLATPHARDRDYDKISHTNLIEYVQLMWFNTDFAVAMGKRI